MLNSDLPKVGDLNSFAEYWDDQEVRMLRYMLANDGMQFFRYFFKVRESSNLLLNWHHYVIDYVLQAVLDMKIPRLIINLGPGYTKTEQSMITFIARGLALNKRAKFIHASYSGDLTKENSSKTMEIVESAEFQQLWPMKIRRDKAGKKMWFTKDGGGMLAVPAGGQITGFRAGRMEEGFTGAFLVDDPVKPADAFSDAKRTVINNRFNNTMRSRLANEHVPFIVNMQRIHPDDLCGFLLKGGSADQWHHLSLPALLTEERLSKPYPEDYTHGIPIDIDKILLALHGGPEYEF